MITDVVNFHELEFKTPDLDAMRAQYDELLSGFDAPSPDLVALLERFEALQRGFDDWSRLADLRFNQDTTNEVAKQTRELANTMTPQVEELKVRAKRALLSAQEGLEPTIGAQAFALWNSDVSAFVPEIKAHLVKEADLISEYVALMASAQIEVDGKTYSLSELRKLDNDADRAVRFNASKGRYTWVKEHEAVLDGIYDQLVALRQQMAQALGHDNYIPVGYQKMRRIDYDSEDVAKFRQEVLDVVVPLVQDMYAARAETLGLDHLCAWDETIHSLEGNPQPAGDYDWMVERAQQMFDAMHPELGGFFSLMNRQNYMDLKARRGKANGGFCTSFSQLGMPFIFANFNGSKGDVEVFTHEMGHAFQNFKSAHKIISDYHWPTTESAEIHSMSLEFLTWPHMELFFEEDAERFRQIHLAEGLAFLPYGVAVDHFQHLVYAQPEASAAQRRQWWAEIEQQYMPWRQWGELEELAQGRRWQLQNHIYSMPFYYIDYTLAQTCALQFWERMQHDMSGALEDYVALCERGGEAPFKELVRSAKLKSPFEPGSLRGVVAKAREALGL